MSLSFIKVLDSTRIWLILSYRIIPCYSQQWAGSLHLFAFLATSGGSQGRKKARCGAERRRTGLLSPLQSATTPSYLRRGPAGPCGRSFSLAEHHDAEVSQKGARGTI